MLGIATQVVALLSSTYALYKVVADSTLTRKPRLREDYEFAKKLLAEVDVSTHNLVLEKGYIALTGDKELRADEIRHFLASSAPSSSLRKYSLGRGFLAFVPATETAKACVRFSELYAATKTRDRFKRHKLIQYWSFAVIAFAPLIFFGINNHVNLPNAIVISIAIMLSFGIMAADSLLDYARMLRAEEIVQEQGADSPSSLQEHPTPRSDRTPETTKQ